MNTPSNQPSGQPTAVRDEHPTLSTVFLAGVQGMEPEAWSRLVHVFGPIVYRWCRTSGIREQDAADVVQEIFASVARGIPEFQRQKVTGSFRAWLATITRNRIRDFYRKQPGITPAIGGTDALHTLHNQPDPLAQIDSTVCSESMQNSLTHQALASVQAEFESNTWQAFWLTAVEGQPVAEVATATGLSLASVYQAKSRVLRRLRKQLKE